MSVFQSNLLQIMQERNIQTKELASDLGVSTVTVQMWRNGRWNLKVEKALALAKRFGTTVEQLFEQPL